MIQEIAYSGLSATPADYNAPDGDLALAINLIPEDGALRPVGSPHVLFRIPVGWHIIYRHKSLSYTNFIIVNANNEVAWIGERDLTPHPIISLDQNVVIRSVCAVGNTLVLVLDDSVQYALWKDGSYISLGDRPPFVSIDFGLESLSRRGSDEFTQREEWTVPLEVIPFTGNEHPGATTSNRKMGATATQLKELTDMVYGQLLALAAEKVNANGLFWQPFFIRYAFRMFDGSHNWASPPILMLPDVNVPVVTVTDKEDAGETGFRKVVSTCHINAMQLNARIIDDGLDALAQWEDVIAGIDVFASAPIYTFDQSKNIQAPGFLSLRTLYGLGAHRTLPSDGDYDRGRPVDVASRASSSTSEFFVGHYAENGTGEYIDHTVTDVASNSYAWYIPANETFNDKIKSTSLFYRIAEIDFKDIKGAATLAKLKLSTAALTNITSLPTLKDDYKSHARTRFNGSYAYNSRLHLFGDVEYPPEPFPIRASMAYGNAGTNPVAVTVTVWSRHDGYRCKAVRNCMLASDMLPSPQQNLPRYIFYPDASAYKMKIEAAGMNAVILELKPHDFLNGAYYYGGLYPGAIVSNATDEDSRDIRDSYPVSNKIYTSEVNNPFYFPLQGINTVGSGRVLGICSAAKALSQGQFGQFPLYAFTDEGVWAMQVAADGTYSARQPITRDVCINPAGITQIDSSVLFPTDRGIMQISGSETQCLTDTVKTDTPFDLLSLPHMQSLHDAMGHPAVDSPDQLCVATLPFTEFLKSCRMVYDYLHQRVVVYNPDVRYAYVLSLKSGQWGMIYSNIVDNVNSYPDALAVDSNGYLVDFSLSPVNTGMSLAVTRPLKIGMPDVLKTVDTVIQRGQFARGHVQTILYGSRDLVSWYLVWSSTDHFLRGFHGTPYKYFRIALLCRLRPGEGVTGATVRFTPRFTNQPR